MTDEDKTEIDPTDLDKKYTALVMIDDVEVLQLRLLERFLNAAKIPKFEIVVTDKEE